ncbi:MAG: TonB-dependent receptor, partial [Candidatus Marinimicrobia bacterium]|nr:TonB-dependent receptor [Candidatus Neomarinimicrobiota bacterium]
MSRINCRRMITAVATVMLMLPAGAWAQGVTTAGLGGIVNSEDGEALAGANIVLVHEPSQTQYGAIGRAGGYYNLLNLKVGGPYTLTVSYIGYKTQTQSDIYLNLGSAATIDVALVEEAILGEAVEVVAEVDAVFNADRTGAATYVGPDELARMPSIKRSTRDITRLDPRSDGNFSFGGRNWLYNNISLDGSYFNNPFGLDDPAPGGQTDAEPVPFDAIEQVQVSVAPFDVREGGFTGAGINIVTKSGTNQLKGSVYSFNRSEAFVGNKVSGSEVIANPDLSFNQSGFTLSGPIAKNKLFFFFTIERERREDPASNFVADRDGNVEFGESRVSAATMDEIRRVMKDEYRYDTGEYENYFHKTENDKIILKIDWNVSANHNLTLRYNRLDAVRDKPPHPFAASYLGTGRGPSEFTLPFQNSGYAINNKLDSYALELNSVFGGSVANRFFFSYNKFRDFRKPVSKDFPTIEIGEPTATGADVTYTTVGHEPFSIHNILDQDVFQFTNNLSYFSGRHVFTGGVNYERFNFFNSFNLFRHGVFLAPADLGILTGGFLPFDFLDFLGATTFSSVDNFFARTNPDSTAKFYDLNALVGSGPFVGEKIDVGQLAFYGQDEFQLSEQIKLTYGLRVDRPIYFTEPVDNPFSRAMILLDENGDPETIDQSKLPDATPLFSPRVGFNWDVNGDRSLQLRGGTGIFTGRLPFVWIGNNISNPGPNPNLFGFAGGLAEEDVPADHETDDGSGRLYEGRSVLKQSFFLNAMVPDFKWPQVWTTDLAVDMKLPGDMLGTFEFLYSKDLNAIYLRNGDLAAPVRNLPDGRPFYDGRILNDSVVVDGNTLFSGGDYSGAFIMDNTSEGYNF